MDYPQFNWMQMQPMRKQGGNQDMGMKLLQAALNQNKQNSTALGAQPQAGATLPGGATNLTPPMLPSGPLANGIGMLRGLLGGGASPMAGDPTGGLGGLY